MLSMYEHAQMVGQKVATGYKWLADFCVLGENREQSFSAELYIIENKKIPFT